MDVVADIISSLSPHSRVGGDEELGYGRARYRVAARGEDGGGGVDILSSDQIRSEGFNNF